MHTFLMKLSDYYILKAMQKDTGIYSNSSIRREVTVTLLHGESLAFVRKLNDITCYSNPMICFGDDWHAS